MKFGKVFLCALASVMAMGCKAEKKNEPFDLTFRNGAKVDAVQMDLEGDRSEVTRRLNDLFQKQLNQAGCRLEISRPTSDDAVVAKAASRPYGKVSIEYGLERDADGTFRLTREGQVMAEKLPDLGAARDELTDLVFDFIGFAKAMPKS